jgi:hypothetical protein
MAMPRPTHAVSDTRPATYQRPSCRARDGGIRTVKRVRVPPYPGIRLTRVPTPVSPNAVPGEAPSVQRAGSSGHSENRRLTRVVGQRHGCPIALSPCYSRAVNSIASEANHVDRLAPSALDVTAPELDTSRTTATGRTLPVRGRGGGGVAGHSRIRPRSAPPSQVHRPP